MAPPWPPRSGSMPGHEQQPRQQGGPVNASPGKPRLPYRPDDLEILDAFALQIDTSSSDSESAAPSKQSRPSRPSHGRSLSHPFPSLFGTWKKKHDHPPGPGEADSDSSGDEMGMPRPEGSSSRSRDDRRPSATEYMSGSCMTCGTLLRWPKHLSMFKCTVCVTINDVRPVVEPWRPDGPSRANAAPQPHSTFPQGPSRLRAEPISLERTKLLARQCLRSYLATVLSQASAADEAAAESKEKSPVSSQSSSTPPRPRASSRGLAETPPAYVTGGSSAMYAGPPTQQRIPLGTPSQTPASGSSLAFSTSFPDKLLPPFRPHEMRTPEPSRTKKGTESGSRGIFKPLEDYLVACFSSLQCLNSSFTTHRRRSFGSKTDEGTRRRPPLPRKATPPHEPSMTLDPKLLLLGDFAENGSWWTGGQESLLPTRAASHRTDDSQVGPSIVNLRTPQLHWANIAEWYDAIVHAGERWREVYDEMIDGDEGRAAVTEEVLSRIERDVLDAQDRLRRHLLKIMENRLKRPGRPLRDPQDVRFLLLFLENPLFHGSQTASPPGLAKAKHEKATANGHSDEPRTGDILSGKHSGIIKRIIGLMCHSSAECHNHLVSWFARYSKAHFIRTKDIVANFLTYRLSRQNEKAQERSIDHLGGLVPKVSSGNSGSMASLHFELSSGRRLRDANAQGPRKRKATAQKKLRVQPDWQIAASARVLGLLFSANISSAHRRADGPAGGQADASTGASSGGGQIIPISDFYNTLLDYTDLVADYTAWQAKTGKFSFCQYPFLLSIWAKIQILEHEAGRRMEGLAMDAFFDSIFLGKNINQYFMLEVRRDCLVEDSLRIVSEVVGSGSDDIKKRLRVGFKGEEGIDIGGLRKEWFLLFVREVFSPDHGMFLYDEDSQYCYFNPNSWETSDQYFLIGVVFGLAIYNSTILDVPLPHFAFRRLLAAANGPGQGSGSRSGFNYTLEDLAEYRPRLAKSLKDILDYEGDVESTFSLDFVIDVDRYGSSQTIVLCPGGEQQPVTNANRREYVDLYIRYLLETSVTRQFEPFKRGFFTVCDGAALSLFRPEEIELLVRGSDEPLDVSTLRAVAEYENWGRKDAPETESTIKWFWETFEQATPRDQRKLLAFITASDRIPAMGAATLVIKLSCLGEDNGRYPIARTCFNTLSLCRYDKRETLERKLWTAVHESEGFGLR